MVYKCYKINVYKIRYLNQFPLKNISYLVKKCHCFEILLGTYVLFIETWSFRFSQILSTFSPKFEH
jgi:hypothetical protein